MGRKRKTHLYLPPNCYWHNKRIRHRINGKWTTLGKTLIEAMEAYGKFIFNRDGQKNMGYLFDLYLVDVSPNMAEETHKLNLNCISRLRQVFGESYPNEIKPSHVYKYLDERNQKSGATRSANIDVNVLQNVMDLAIRKGLIDKNPCAEVKRLKVNKKIKIPVTAEMLQIFRDNAPDLLKLVVDFFDLTALRKKDVRIMSIESATDDGLRIRTSKKGKVMLFTWTPALRECFDEIMKLPRPADGNYLFYSKLGTPFTTSGFNSMWRRTMNRLIEEKLIDTKFNYHDLRRKVAADVKKLRGIEGARDYLGHESTSQTAKYVVVETVVTPLK